MTEPPNEPRQLAPELIQGHVPLVRLAGWAGVPSLLRHAAEYMDEHPDLQVTAIRIGYGDRDNYAWLWLYGPVASRGDVSPRD